MNSSQVENNVQQLVKTFNKETFIYDLLLTYDTPKSTIKRLQKGDLNLSKVENEIDWKKKLFFKTAIDENVQELFEEVRKSDRANKHNPRFIIVTDFETLIAIDTKTEDLLNIPIAEIAKHYDFFLPWAGMEKAQNKLENPADVKAAERMAKLYDEIQKDNATHDTEAVHNLNVFLSRLLFCFFAEDTEIFTKGQFTNGISSHTQADGSDLKTYLDTLFEVLNTDYNQRKNLPAFLSAFPYVNGGLFKGDKHYAPNFTRRSRQVLIESGELDWSAINPDIFGSMIQAVITPEHRGGLGMHYTSVPNIMKVIEPLFLTELYEEFEAAKYDPRRLHKLLERIGKIKIFDPACGSGNFLIIAYKELRLLEIKILQQLQTLQQVATGFEPKQLELIPKAQLTLAASYQQTLFSRIELYNFYGIELDDFAHEVAILSLWLAQHQMNMRFKEAFGTGNPTLPLQAGGNIVQGNATRIDWEKVCPKKEGDEIYILGNPPYLGGKLLNQTQKEDTEIVFKGFENYNNLDYIACWFYKSALYITKNIKVAFVSTNSISQGTQVNDLWPNVFKLNIEIFFTHKDFPWSNNAKNKAAVICSIIGLRYKSLESKFIFSKGIKHEVKNINGYLTNATNIFIQKRTTPLSIFPDMNQGNIPLDNGHLMFSEDEKNDIIQLYPSSIDLFKKVSGSAESINNIVRWCLWLSETNLELALSIPTLKNRIENVRDFRIKGGTNAKSCANRPHEFCMVNKANSTQIVVPIISSERRDYIPISYFDGDFIIIHSAYVIYDPELYIFSIINSAIHILWVKTFSGKLKNDSRYSVGLCWYSFPFPEISEKQKQELEQHAYNIFAEREKDSEKTLAQLYDPEKMPDGLREAHHQLDLAVERCYRSKPFESDEERLEYLFKLYEQMITAEKDKDSLFKTALKTKKGKK